jgi:hypothetical protein
MSQASAFRPQSLVYARSVANANTVARQPAGFATGGPVARVYNSGATDVAIAFYNFTNGTPGLNAAGADPVLVFPVDGAPPTGQPSTVVAKGTVAFIDGVSTSDSFVAFGSAAGPGIIYVSKGDGNGPN